MAMIKHETVLDIFRYFTIFSTDKKFRKFKVVCRYQQYEGANLMVERVKSGKPKKGLIWHFQGSGKSLLMVFAAQKLRMTKELNNATVTVISAILSGYKVEQQGYKACMGFLKLADKYTPERLEFACRKALTFTPRPSLKNIQAILSSGQDKVSEEPAEKPSESKYGFTRGAEYYGGKK